MVRRCGGVVGALLAALVLAACGSDSDAANPGAAKTAETRPPAPAAKHHAANRSAKPAPKQRTSMSKAEIAKLPQFEITRRNGPPPHKLVIHDLRKGTGAVMKRGDEILTLFVGVKYGQSVKTTPATRNSPEKFWFGELVKSWQVGLPGMRVGGRRELIVPARLGTGSGPLVYVIDLLAVYPNGGSV
jgi:peptidylprolyl isomerase